MHVVFTIAGAMRAKRDEKRIPMPMSPPGRNWLISLSERASEASANSFDAWLDDCTNFRRSSGSPICVPSGTTIADTELPPALACSALRSEIGHIASNEASGSSPFAVR